jgi:ABC-type multidrug transport system ATPase subunit
VLVLGAARALFEAAAGLRAIAHGELRVEGLAPGHAIRAGLAASAALDPPVPPSWTFLQYVTWSARLAGHARAAAEALAHEALGRMGQDPLARTRMSGAPVHARRAAVIAAALATGATTLLVEDPLVGLSAEESRSLARRLCGALTGRRAAVFAARVALESPVALAADEAILVDDSRVIVQGRPAEVATRERAFALTLEGDVKAFVDAVQAGGGRLLGAPGAPTGARQHRLSVELGPLATRDVLRIAAELGAAVLELRPLGRAFA